MLFLERAQHCLLIKRKNLFTKNPHSRFMFKVCPTFSGGISASLLRTCRINSGQGPPHCILSFPSRPFPVCDDWLIGKERAFPECLPQTLKKKFKGKIVDDNHWDTPGPGANLVICVVLLTH